MLKNKQITYVGVDDGHDSIKLVKEDGSCYITPSRVVAGKSMLCSINGDEVEDNFYDVNGDIYSVIDFITQSSISYIDTRTQDYPYSKHNVALINHALYKSGLTGDISVLTGLPVQRFYQNGVKNNELIEKKVRNLLDSKITNLNEQIKLPTIKEHRVISEALAGYFDLLFDIHGKKNHEIEEISSDYKIAIVDIGGRTTDIATIDIGGNSIDTNKSGTKDIGVLYLRDCIRTAIMNEFKLNDASNAILDKIMNTGSFRNCGKITDVSHIVNSEKSKTTNVINAFINKTLDTDFNEHGLVVFIGGGSLLFKEELKKRYANFNNVVLVDNPQFANARGMLKFNKYVRQ